MDEALIRARLAQVEWHITVGEQTIARQRVIIAKLSRGGLVTANAEGTLRVLEQTQAARMADRDRLDSDTIDITLKERRVAEDAQAIHL